MRGRQFGGARARAFGAAMLVFAAGGCHEKSRTEIIVGIATDLMAPMPLTTVSLEVSRFPEGEVLGAQPFTISGNVNNIYELPGTYAIYSPEGTADRVRIVLTATDNKEQMLVLRSAVLSLVPEKTLFVRLGVVMACVAKPECPPGDTCIDGRCLPEAIDSSRLPSYTAGMEKEVNCAGTGAGDATFVNTSTKVPLPVTDATCPNKGVCQEGVCLGSTTSS